MNSFFVSYLSGRILHGVMEGQRLHITLFENWHSSRIYSRPTGLLIVPHVTAHSHPLLLSLGTAMCHEFCLSAARFVLVLCPTSAFVFLAMPPCFDSIPVPAPVLSMICYHVVFTCFVLALFYLYIPQWGFFLFLSQIPYFILFFFF